MLQSRVQTKKRAESDSLGDQFHEALGRVHDELLCETERSVERLLAAWQDLERLPVEALPTVLRPEWQSVASRVDLLRAGSLTTPDPHSIGEAADVITVLLCMEYTISRARRDRGVLRLLPANPRWK